MGKLFLSVQVVPEVTAFHKVDDEVEVLPVLEGVVHVDDEVVADLLEEEAFVHYAVSAALEDDAGLEHFLESVELRRLPHLHLPDLAEPTLPDAVQHRERVLLDDLCLVTEALPLCRSSEI